ncbi:GAF domain-containing protein [Actinomadura madurae]|uniref:GAF domain-containing protein n=2 Tax=Thermomonosporaceae TaxID=2012 RepID=A0A1I5JQF4_9ACTN|nr:GAF domain-containing protein [Actinomadura madurae]
MADPAASQERDAPREAPRSGAIIGEEGPPIRWRPPAGPRPADGRHRLAASFDLMAAVLAGADPVEALALLAEHARAMARVPLAFVALPEEGGGTLRIDVAVGPAADRIRGLTVRRGRSMIGRAFSSRRPLSSRVAVDQGLSELPAGPILMLPLETGEAIRGVLAVAGSPGAPPFTAALARDLLLFADLGARLIELAEERRAAGPAPADGAHATS